MGSHGETATGECFDVLPFMVHTEVMRLVVVALVLLGTLALPASAAEADPSLLVLREADVPAGFKLDPDQTGVLSNASQAKGAEAAERALLRRSGRTTGYESDFDLRDTKIKSRADVFRKAQGAKLVLNAAARAFDISGVQGMRRTPVRIGDEGWVYGGPSRSSTVNFVVWRYDRVYAGVAVWGVTKARTIAMARTQQRRIAAALR
jgi:hypothetical protein